MDFFKFMIKDRLFTALAVNTYPANSHIRKTPRLHWPKDSRTLTDEMPIFHHLEHYIKDVHSHSNTMQGGATSQQFGKGNQGNNTFSRNSFQGKTFGGGEQALAAETSDTSQKQNFFIRAHPVQGVYNGEIDRKRSLYVTDLTTGHKGVYTATRTPCPTCYLTPQKDGEKLTRAPGVGHGPGEPRFMVKNAPSVVYTGIVTLDVIRVLPKPKTQLITHLHYWGRRLRMTF